MDGEEKIAALTAGDRSQWGLVRQNVFFKGPNRVALDIIEKSAFFVCLDDVPYVFDEKNPSLMDQYGRILLHGKGYDRWFDKSFTLCIGTNAKVSHSLIKVIVFKQKINIFEVGDFMFLGQCVWNFKQEFLFFRLDLMRNIPGEFCEALAS